MFLYRPFAPLEPLESRTLFNTLIFQGTAGDDFMSISVQKEVITTVLNGTATFWADDGYDAIEVRGLEGDDSIVVYESGDNDLFVFGDMADGSGAGNDLIDIADGNLDAVPAPVVVHGGGGEDLVRLHDHNNNFSDPFTITSSTAGRFFFGGLTYGSDVESLVVNNSRRSSTITVSSTSPATRVSINSGLGADTINVNETHPASPIGVLPSAGTDWINVNSDGAGSAAVRFEQSLRLFSLMIDSGGSATVAPAGERVVTLSQLILGGTGRFDVTDNAAIIDYAGSSPIAEVQTQLSRGYNNGAWNGSGILSSTAASGNTAVGYAEATDLFSTFPATFMGQNVDDTSILLAHTRYGDANLDRAVNLADFNRLAANFGQSSRRWSQGEFDFNGTVNLSDFNRLAANFGGSVAAAFSPMPSDDLPSDFSEQEQRI